MQLTVFSNKLDRFLVVYITVMKCGIEYLSTDRDTVRH